MKKLINRVEDVLAESLRGFEAAHGDASSGSIGIPVFLSRAAPAPEGKVALVSGGGSGHEPLHGGFVGRGMLDAACPGQVFTSPTPDQMLAAAQAVDRGAGVLFIVKNYSGDVMNFEMAVEMYEGTAATVLTNDDVAVEDSTYTTGRRGVAGTLVVEKVVGAAAESGADLEACRALGTRINERTRVDGRRADELHRAGGRKADLRDRRGRDGDGRGDPRRAPGAGGLPLASADEIAAQLVEPMLGGLSPAGGERALLLINGFGRHSADGADADVRRGAQSDGVERRRGRPKPGGQLRHVPGHGRLLGYPVADGRRGPVAMGCAGAYRGAAVGMLKPAMLNCCDALAQDTVT